MVILNPEILIEFVHVTKKFGGFPAVGDLSFEIRRGEILGILGPNGAGKSTTMKLLAYLLRPTLGEIRIRRNGEMQKLKSSNYDYLLDNVGFFIEIPAFYDHMTPRQHLTYFAKLKGYPRSKITQRVEALVQQIGLKDWIDRPLKTFSKGMRQKIGVLAAVVHDPAVIVLDEPTGGLDPQASKELRDYILSLKQEGKTIFLSSHLLFEVSEIADRIAIIMNGHLQVCDTIENLRKNAHIGNIRMETTQDLSSQSAQAIINKLTPILEPLTGLDAKIWNKKSLMNFNPNTQQFEIIYNGERENQARILHQMITEGIPVSDFTVPKISLLENLYLGLTHKAEQEQKKITKESIQLKNVL